MRKLPIYFLLSISFVLPGKLLAQTNLALNAVSSTSYVSPWETLSAVNDGHEPSNSNDKSNGAYGNWNNPNSIQWVQYDWPSEVTITSTQIYWFDDAGGVLTPTTAYVEFWDGTVWVNAGTLPKVKDAWNTLNLNSVTTKKFRVSMLNTSQSTGILEWQVYGSSDGGGSAGGDAYTWPAYSPNISYNFRDEFPSLPMPTQVLDDCPEVVGTQSSGWWTFRWGPNANSLVTANAITPLLERMNKDFAYFRDEMGWPPDLRAKNGYKSAIYLYGSGLCTDDASNTDLGGWQSSIFHDGKSWPMVLASYYPIYSFDPSSTYADKESQQSAMVHEGIHAVLADLPGVKKSAWFHEGGNVWLQQTADARRSGDYSSMGFLNGTDFIAPFMPIESYTGWLQDGSFGGPSAEGVNMFDGNQQICTWRTYLGGHQYSSSFPTFLGNVLGDGAVPWIWRYCPERVLEGIAGGLGEAQTRRLISEYRAKQALVDFGPWTAAIVSLLDANFERSIGAEWQPSWLNPDPWTATPYVKTTNDGNGLLTPEARTTPGWSGANQIPLTVSGNMVTVNFDPKGQNMTCQLAYRSTDGTPVYSELVAEGDVSLRLDKAPANGVVVAVITNTDYIYEGESTRTAHYDYRLRLVSGVSGTADIYTKWYQSANLVASGARTAGSEPGIDMSKYCSHAYHRNKLSEEERKLDESGILVYPNPSAKGSEIQMQFDNPNSGLIAVSVINSSGEVVYEGQTRSNSIVITPAKKLAAGMYVAVIKSSGVEHRRKLVIVDKD